jgi:hypothetical protein
LYLITRYNVKRRNKTANAIHPLLMIVQNKFSVIIIYWIGIKSRYDHTLQ